MSDERALRSGSDGGCDPEKSGTTRVDSERGFRNPGWMLRELEDSSILFDRRSDVIAASKAGDKAYVKIGSGTKEHVRSEGRMMRPTTYVLGDRP